MKRNDSTLLSTLLGEDRPLDTVEHIALAFAVGLAVIATLQLLS